MSWNKTVRTACCLLIGACAHIPPPPLAPQVPLPANRRYDHSLLRESRYLLPRGTLTSESSVAVLDATRLCFDVVLRALEVRPDLASFDAWHIFLQVQGKSEVRLENPEIYPISWEEPPERATLGRSAAPLLVLRGTVCFPNRGAVNLSTPSLSLHLEDPKADAITRQYAKFDWTLARGMPSPAD